MYKFDIFPMSCLKILSMNTKKTPSVSKFIVPDWGDKVNSGIGLSYWPARRNRPAGRYDNPIPESTISPPVRDYIFGYRGHVLQYRVSNSLVLISQKHLNVSL
jgi:hypothetical protein